LLSGSSEVVIDPVEELLQVHIHGDRFALADVLLRFGYGLMRRAAGAEPVALVAIDGMTEDNLRDAGSSYGNNS
jgi:hypothetical protein